MAPRWSSRVAPSRRSPRSRPRSGRRAGGRGSDFAAVESLVAEAKARHGRVAGDRERGGIDPPQPAHLTSEAELAETLRLNVQTAFAAVRAAGRVMTDGGSVLLFSSAAAETGLPNHEAIAAAKGAIAGSCGVRPPPTRPGSCG